MPTVRKSNEIDLLTSQFEASQMVILADYRGLSVAQMQEFRGKLRSSEGEFRVSKNTLVRIAAERAGVEGLETFLEGPTAVVFAKGDIAGTAKAVSDFARTSRILQVKAGVMDGQALSAADVEAISNLPSREELLAKLVGMLASPMARTVGVLSGPSRSVAYLVNARMEQLGGGDAAAD
ncbi:MAG: 50S ribosomal protein L10 [Thermomicrobiales bacterium]|nr:50S ribosomal protein L10 [Thermomicrobiales bacterium]MCO5217837.1 50S ribosomal protein L10 [Thermomicrobiales bacterium]MCO5223905.1 50S ribosomal protein L10 [Thermomicrobiales bacterium]MCO5227468.1 50S ribosomal protein L10 [Thermomicrobiales bacterium]